jgi:hypothetical protein
MELDYGAFLPTVKAFQSAVTRFCECVQGLANFQRVDREAEIQLAAEEMEAASEAVAEVWDHRND